MARKRILSTLDTSITYDALGLDIAKEDVALAGERQKFCVHGIIGARQTGASNEHEHQTQFS